jgi:8-oxo-dGTP pyrophosphatase MutT (NUDIX family)
VGGKRLLKSGSETGLDRIRRSILRNPGKKLEGHEYLSLPKAAVAVILRQDNQNGIMMLLLKRKTSETDPWSGHMAFPGGRMKDSDLQKINTAKRETFEETGIDLGKYEFLGSLDELPPGNRSVTVTPFVFFAAEDVKVKVEAREINDYVWIPISFFTDKKNSVAYSVESMGAVREVESFPYLGKFIVWGMTLRVINDFLSKIG